MLPFCIRSSRTVARRSIGWKMGFSCWLVPSLSENYKYKNSLLLLYMVNRQTIFDLQQKAPTKGGLFVQNGWRSVESGRMTDEYNKKHRSLRACARGTLWKGLTRHSTLRQKQQARAANASGDKWSAKFTVMTLIWQPRLLEGLKGGALVSKSLMFSYNLTFKTYVCIMFQFVIFRSDHSKCNILIVQQQLLSSCT